MDAAELRDLPPATDEQQPPADRGVGKHVPEDRAEDEGVIETQRHAQKAGDDDRIDQTIGDAADRLLIAEPQRQPMSEGAHPHRDDQGVHAKIDNEESVDEFDDDAHRQRREDRDADRQAVVHVDNGEYGRGEGEPAGDREIVIAGRQGNDQAEGDHDDDGLRSEYGGEIRPGQKRFRTHETENRDRDSPDQQERQALEPIDKDTVAGGRASAKRRRLFQNIAQRLFSGAIIQSIR